MKRHFLSKCSRETQEDQLLTFVLNHKYSSYSSHLLSDQQTIVPREKKNVCLKNIEKLISKITQSQNHDETKKQKMNELNC